MAMAATALVLRDDAPAPGPANDNAPAAGPANDNAPAPRCVAWKRNYHRFYEPETGRYIQSDPLLARGVRGIHPYSYAANNPIKYIDPRGTTITTHSPQVESALQNLKLADPFLREIIERLERTTDFDVEVVDVGTWTDPQAWRTLIEAGWQGAGTVADCRQRKFAIAYSVDLVQLMEDLSKLGFFYTPEQILGHELAHVYNDPWGPLPPMSTEPRGQRSGLDEPFAFWVENLLRVVPRNLP